MRKREIPEPKRLVADCTKEIHNTIMVHCVRNNIKMKEFVTSAVLEKYQRDKEM